MNTNEAKYHLYEKKLERAIELVEEELEIVKGTGMVSDFTKLMDLYQGMLSRERRMALNGMYLGESIATAAERLVTDEDRRAVNEITTLLKAL